MLNRNSGWIIVCCILPNNPSKNIGLAKYFLTDFLEAVNLIIINRNEYYTIISQQISSQLKP